MKELYLQIMDKVVDAYTSEHIRRYTDSVIENGLQEHGFPRLTANLGVLIANGRKQEYKELFLEMMALCCREIPTAHEKNGDRVGNDFSVKEIVLCILEIERTGAFDKSLTDEWRKALSGIDPYKVYTKIAPNPPAPVNNWAAFGAASEQLRKYAGIGDESFFINNQIASQMFSFDENGMYRDPHEPVVYDMVTRLQLAATLHFGYDGEYKDALSKQLEKSACLTLKMQSVTGEIPFGGRSNQFLHNETFYAALCEFYAVFFKKKGDMHTAGMFKRAAQRAVESIIPWLEESLVSHIKNYYPIDSMYGCESYAYYDKYMVTAASWAYLACVICDEDIAEEACPSENENYVCETSEHFHKTFLKYNDYCMEIDTAADYCYDSSGIGRIHKKGAPSAICLSVPFAKNPKYYIDTENPSPLSICAGIKTDSGFVYSYDEETVYTVKSKEVTADFVKYTYECQNKNGLKTVQTCTVSENGVEIQAEGEGEIKIVFPMFDFDGKVHTEKTVSEKSASVLYKGWKCVYTTDGMLCDEKEVYSNRNGHYTRTAVSGKNIVTLKIEMMEA